MLLFFLEGQTHNGLVLLNQNKQQYYFLLPLLKLFQLAKGKHFVWYSLCVVLSMVFLLKSNYLTKIETSDFMFMYLPCLSSAKFLKRGEKREMV